MALTPIRVRGRRKRNYAQHLKEPELNISIRKSDRAGRQRIATPNTNKHSRKERVLSPFERLPTEIVQAIFAYCEDVSLPLSSFVFARKLSHEHVYTQFAENALYEDSQTDRERHATVVSALLQCKWLTWPLFKTILIKVHARHVRYDADHSTPSPDFDNPAVQGHLTYTRLREPVQLPQKLLKAPWTADKTHFLYFLIWTGVGINWENSSHGEIALHGLEQAIQEKNSTAVASLVSPIAGVVPSLAILRSAIIDYGCNKTIVFHLLESAMRAHILARTMGHAITDVNFQDPSIWHWVERVKRAGNEKGVWLTTALRYATDAVSRRSIYDEDQRDDFVRACGAEEDGVYLVRVPLST